MKNKPLDKNLVYLIGRIYSDRDPMKQEIKDISIIADTFQKNTPNLLYLVDNIAAIKNVLSPISETIVEIKEPKNGP